MVFLGIDPGKSGAVGKITLSLLDGNGTFTVQPTPVREKEYDIHAMYSLLATGMVDAESTFCVIERSQAMPGQGVVSMFEFGKGYGLWLALLTALGIPYQVVHSRVWTKELLAGSPGEGKERNINAARAMFPAWNPKLKKDLLLCDALLLAEYARRKWSNK